MSSRKRIAVLLLTAIVLAGGAGYALSQSISVSSEARVVVYKHDDGHVEVALEQGGERYLPEARFVGPSTATGRWLRSSPVTIAVEVPEPEPVLVEVPVEVLVEVPVEVPVEEPVVRLSVRPSDHPVGLACLEEEDAEGNTWTWTNDEGEVESFDTAFGVYTSGIWFGWATGLELEGILPARQQEMRQSAAWHAQCASYHGIDVRNEDEYAIEPDDWAN